MLHGHRYRMYIIICADNARFLIIHPVSLAVVCIVDIARAVYIRGPDNIVYIPAQKDGGLNLDGNTPCGKRHAA